MRSFFVMLMAVGSVVSIAEWFMYRTAFSWLSSKWGILVLALPVFTFALINGYMHFFPRMVTRVLAWVSGIYMAFFFYSFLLFLLFLVCLFVGKVLGMPTLAPRVARYGAYFIGLLLVVGTYIASHQVYREETLVTKKPLARPLKIAFVADIHLGELFGTSFNQGMVEMVNKAKPDLILIGGDIVDNDLHFVLNEGSLEPLKELKAPLGVYAVYGNHDVMRGTGPEEGTYLNSLGLKMVCNDSVEVREDIMLTGLDDFMRSHNAYDFKSADSKKLSIFMEHQPRSILKAAAKGYDMSFAGHTHAGQFYPVREITKRMYVLDYGSKFFDQMFATVTNGYGLWGIPIRIGPSPEVVIINVKNEK